jgi:hypothetical protein
MKTIIIILHHQKLNLKSTDMNMKHEEMNMKHADMNMTHADMLIEAFTLLQLHKHQN